MERIQENAQSFSCLQTASYGEASTAFVEETIYYIASVKNMINKILPSPQHADHVELLGNRGHSMMQH